MNEKDYEECFDRLDKYVFSRDMAVKEDWYDLLNYHQQQLQAKQDKEDKLRELCNKAYNMEFKNINRKMKVLLLSDVEQILNEGSEIDE